MGQHHTKDEWLQYSNKDFFQQQIDFYKWRANPQINTHICRVNFQLQQSIQDRQKLKILLQTKFQIGQYVSLNDILKLAQNKSSKSKEELMNFQNYFCTLHDLQERLSLPQTLHCLQILFSGYEVLYAKLGKLKVKLIYVFINREGEIRCWFNKDYKSNDILQDQSEIDRNSPLLNSQMAIIKKILQLGQRLVTNHTQYLHFSRQFRSYMERDILHNWNFSNARKLINSYAYTYKLNIPNNLRQTLKRMQQASMLTTISVNSYSQVQSSHTSLKQSKQSKQDFMSTGDVFVRKEQAVSNPTSSRKQNPQRPISLSDYSIKKSEQHIPSHYKMHGKKFSSIDLKNLNERKHLQTPKLSRSQLVSSHSQSEFRTKTKQLIYQQTPTHQAGNKMRRQRQFAFVGQSPEAKLNSTQLTPHSNTFSITHFESAEASNQKLQDSKIKNKQNVNHTILKQTQNTKQKKKLQKKAAVVSKYISFFQQTKQLSNGQISNSSAYLNRAEQQKTDERMNISPNPSYTNQSKNQHTQKQQFIKEQFSQPKLDTVKKSNSNLISEINKVSFDNFQNNASLIMPFKGKTQNNKNWHNNDSNVGSHNSSQNHRMCYTIKTLNKLVNNSQVSLHQSNGSFSSINASEGSQYKGVLAKMGRSVDMINLPSNKNVPAMIKRPTTNSHLNKSINN